MSGNFVTHLDAERYDNEQIRRRFVEPPGISLEFPRSTLVVGRRGSGKTMLLRAVALRHQELGVVAHEDLRLLLADLREETGTSGWSVKGIAASLEPRITAKSLAIVGVWLAREAERAGAQIDYETVRRVLPRERRNPVDNLDDLREDVAAIPYEQFQNPSARNAFSTLCHHLWEATWHDGELLVVLDRAEDIPYPAFAAVLALLDQGPLKAVVATRPGPMWAGAEFGEVATIPSDHYDVKHLGFDPYSVAWHDFIGSVLGAATPQVHDAVRPQIQAMQLVCRDSVRDLLDVAINSVDPESQTFRRGRMEARIRSLQINHTKAAHAMLRHLDVDLEHKVLPRLRDRAAAESGEVRYPVTLQFVSQDRALRFEAARTLGASRLEKFFALGLRSGLLTLRPGVPWHPNMQMIDAEVAPIYLWQPGDPWSGDVPPIEILEEELFPEEAQSDPVHVFAAYPFDTHGPNLREWLVSRFGAIHRLRGVQVDDGRVELGAFWPDEVRDRIRDCGLLVLDLSLPGKELFFEYGFAHGAHRPVLPVVTRDIHRNQLPDWMQSVRVAVLDDQNDENKLIDLIGEIVSQERHPSRGSTAVPGRVAFRLFGSNDAWLPRFESAALGSGLEVDRSVPRRKDRSHESPRGGPYVHSSLALLELTGGPEDHFANYVAGRFVAQPHAGESRERLVRQVVLCAEDAARAAEWAAASARFASDVVQVVSFDEVPPTLREYGVRWKAYCKRLVEVEGD